MIITLKKENDGKHKFKVRIDGKTVKFGAYGMSDYTLHKDAKRKKLYILRHKGMGEDWNDIKTAGFWARWLLWNKPTLEDSIKSIEKKFNVNIIYK